MDHLPCLRPSFSNLFPYLRTPWSIFKPFPIFPKDPTTFGQYGLCKGSKSFQGKIVAIWGFPWGYPQISYWGNPIVGTPLCYHEPLSGLVTTNLADYGAPPIVWIDHGFLATTDRTASAVPPSDLLAENPKHHSMAFTCQARKLFGHGFQSLNFRSIGMTHSTITYKNIQEHNSPERSPAPILAG